jgi:hypothetical protein
MDYRKLSGCSLISIVLNYFIVLYLKHIYYGVIFKNLIVYFGVIIQDDCLCYKIISQSFVSNPTAGSRKKNYWRRR